MVLTGWLALVAGPDATRPVAAIGGLAVVVLAGTLVVGRPEGVVAALALLGGCYAIILLVDEPPLDVRSAVVGAALLVVGELAHLSLAARLTVTTEADAVARRIGFVAVLAIGALAVGIVVLALVDLLSAGGVAVEAIGAAAAASTIGLLALAARDAGKRH